MELSHTYCVGYLSLNIHVRNRGVGKGGGGWGGWAPQILSSCYYVYKQLPQKDVQNVLL